MWRAASEEFSGRFFAAQGFLQRLRANPSVQSCYSDSSILDVRHSDMSRRQRHDSDRRGWCNFRTGACVGKGRHAHLVGFRRGAAPCEHVHKKFSDRIDRVPR